MSDDVFRVPIYDALRPLVTRLKDEGAYAFEISGTALRNEFGWPAERLVELAYPMFDVTDTMRSFRHAARYDLVFADQVLEHVIDPAAAIETVRRILAPGGTAILTTVCLFPLHDLPRDFWRFTPQGLSQLFTDGWKDVQVGSWGNRMAVKFALEWQQINRDAKVREQLLVVPNDPLYPVVVWVTARRP